MLPLCLSANLCSLVAGQDRLAFSVVFKMNENAEVTDEWFGRSIIKSCVKLTYSHSQVFFILDIFS